MRKEYESSADERDQAQQDATAMGLNAFNLAQMHGDRNKDEPVHRQSNSSGSSDKPPNAQPRNESTQASKAASKETGKEAGKEAAKEGTKEGAKKAGETAMAATGVGLAVDAAVEAGDKLKNGVDSIGNGTKKAIQEHAERVNDQGNVTAIKKKPENMAEDTTGIKIVIGAIAVFVAMIILVVVILVSVIFTLLAPVTKLFEGILYAKEWVGTALDDLGEDHSYEAIAEMYKDKMKDALTKAFDEVSYNEVYQIAVEQDYDIELTMESYANNDFPYILDGDNCNVNYLEIFTVMSMDERFNILNFNYDEFKEVFEDTEFLRCLYDLDVTRAEHIVYDEDEYDENGVLIHDGTGEILDIIVYGEVTIKEYPLKKLFDYFNIDPYATNLNFPTMTNYQALSIVLSTTKLEAPNINWGYSGISRMLDYSLYTGEINENGENIYADQMHNDIVVGNYNIVNGVPVYAQGDPAWGSLSYGSGKIRSLGCCLTSMSMVSSYFTGSAITPAVMSELINNEYSGALKRDSIAKYYGFKQYDTKIPFSASHAVGELNAGRLLIVHIKNGHLGHSPKYGHYIVITGVNTTGEEAYFTIADPAGGKTYELTASEALYHLDYEWSYGY